MPYAEVQGPVPVNKLLIQWKITLCAKSCSAKFVLLPAEENILAMRQTEFTY